MWPSRAVTFVENHDTGGVQDLQLKCSLFYLYAAWRSSKQQSRTYENEHAAMLLDLCRVPQSSAYRGFAHKV